MYGRQVCDSRVLTGAILEWQDDSGADTQVTPLTGPRRGNL